MTESKYFFLKTKLDNEDKRLDMHNFFKLVEHKIGWQEYTDLLTEFSKNSYLEGGEYELLTNLGKNKLAEFEEILQRTKTDEEARRKKLHNEAVISGWKRKTFWYIFAIGLFGGVYSGIDLFKSLTKEKGVEKEVITKEQIESELNEMRALILSQKKSDTLNNLNSESSKK